MFERRISAQEVRVILKQGDVLEEYPDDVPFPGRLVIGYQRERHLHVVTSDDREGGTTIVITVYQPDSSQWEPPDYRRKRIQP